MFPAFLLKNQRSMEQSRIEELIRKERLTSAEKEEIRAAADAAGIQYNVKQGCRQCYERILLKLYDGTVAEANTSKDGWRLKDPRKAFRMAGVLYNNETIKGMEIGGINPFVRSKYFTRSEPENQNNEQGGEV